MATSSMHKPGWRSRRRSRLTLVERAVPRLGRMPEVDAAAGPNRNGEPAGEKTQDADDRLQATSPADEGGARATAQADAAPALANAERPAAPAPAMALPIEAVPTPEPSSALTHADDAADEPERPDADPQHQSSGPLLELDWDRLIESGFVDPRNRVRSLPKAMDAIVRALIRQALSDQSSWRDRVILVTSPTERRSKTAAAINCAFGLTTVADHQVVLVDVDTLGEGAVARLGGGERDGIAAALEDESLAVEDVAIGTDLDRLTLVASGEPDSDILDHFASRRMMDILQHLTKDPETILIIDTPPILLSQEAAVLSVVAGQVVMSVEAGRTTADQIDHALQRIGERHNVSLVLNESGGLAERDPPAAAARAGDAMRTKRRVPGNKRPVAGAAAAVTGAVMFGLLGMQAAATTGSIPDGPLWPYERWSAEPDMMTATSCRHCR